MENGVKTVWHEGRRHYGQSQADPKGCQLEVGAQSIWYKIHLNIYLTEPSISKLSEGKENAKPKKGLYFVVDKLYYIKRGM
jgi:hypothetical protein